MRGTSVGASPLYVLAGAAPPVTRPYMILPATNSDPGSVAGGLDRQKEQRRSVMTDRRDEERDRREREDTERRREEDERRSDELREAWRRNHPSRPEEDEGRRPGRGGA